MWNSSGRAGRSISVERVGSVLGRLPVELLGKLDEALRLHLAF
jgi:hypothetical protein